MEPVKPDLSLIGDYSERPQPVGITRFGDKGQSVSFINARHYSDTAETNNPTARTTAAAITLLSSPKAVIIEATDAGNPPKGDPAYAAQLAGNKGIPVIAGEPKDADVFKAMEGRGYSTKDTMGMYLLRRLERDAYPSEEAFDKGVSKYFGEHKAFDHIPKDQRMTAEEFKSWYAEHNQTGKPFLQITGDDVGPSKTDTFFGKMTRDSGIVRDEHLAQVIADATNKHGDVLVVYGEGHLRTLKPVLEQMLGKGETTMVVPPPSTNISGGVSCDSVSAASCGVSEGAQQRTR